MVVAGGTECTLAPETSAGTRPIPNQARPALRPPPRLSRPEGASGESLAASTGAPLQRHVPPAQGRHVALRRGESERASALGARGVCSGAARGLGAAQSGAAGRRRHAGPVRSAPAHWASSRRQHAAVTPHRPPRLPAGERRRWSRRRRRRRRWRSRRRMYRRRRLDAPGQRAG